MQKQGEFDWLPLDRRWEVDERDGEAVAQRRVTQPERQSVTRTLYARMQELQCDFVLSFLGC